MGIMSLAEIMDQSIDILRKYVKTIILFTLGYGIITFIAILVIVLVGTFTTVPFINTMASNPLSIGFFPIVMMVILFLSVYGFTIAANVGMIHISSQDILDKRIYASHAIGASFKSIFRVFGVVVLGFLLFLPIVAAFGGVFYLLYRGFMGSMISLSIYQGREILLIVVSIIAGLTGILSFLAYSTWFSFSLHALALENKGVFASIKRSFELVRGNFWRIFGCSLLIYLTVYVIQVSIESFVGIIVGIIYLIMRFLNVQQDFMTLLTVVYTQGRWPVNLLSWLILSPISMTMMTLLYYNQRFKYEGFDISLNLKKLQNAMKGSN